ncbi:hypothetical protein ACAW74_22460 [Fibrella sp. WM1]|uniref:hypothetical protein n=1 Tax=Fibrella musci TaxID=3242485 RepID=UPI0035205587
MKLMRLFTCLLAGLFAATAFAQNKQKVTFLLKNNGTVFKEFKFLERHPDDKSPNVFTAHLQPGETYKVQLKVGTSLAQVNQEEIYASMRGLTVTGKPLLVVNATDAGKTINLIQKANSSR